MNSKTKETIQKCLMLVEDNLRTSASTSGLWARKDNLRQMEKILTDLLGISEEEADTLFWDWIKEE